MKFPPCSRPFTGYVLILLTILISACQSGDANTNPPSAPLPEIVDFNFHIKPILSDRCFACHGPDEKARKGDLRLDLEETAFAALDSAGKRFAIVPGDIEKSLLLHRLNNTDPEERMPPPESNLTVSDREIALLQKWIEQGAEWKPHWAFMAPKRPEIQKTPDSDNNQHPIDYFVRARLAEAGLKPAREASKEKLIRRLSFDLRGLPPSLAEIDAFLADESPDAYAHLVDRLLAEPAYGERMAMEWMDLARYADSHGYQDDLERSMWPWREWVIQAFNQNMPYDQFVSWQLSGDLLPEPTYEQQLATAFNRNHKITQEVGVIDEEYRVTYVLDRVNTFSTAFLGLTVECAQCHDHKYDPISQKEYYSLFSFFNQVPEKGRVDYGVEVAAPYLPLPAEKVTKISTYVHDLLARKMEQQTTYAETALAKMESPSPQNRNAGGSIPEGLVAWYPFDYIEEGESPEEVGGGGAKALGELVPIPGKFAGGIECMGGNYAELEPISSLKFGNPFSLSFWIQSLDGGIRGPVLAAMDRQGKTSLLLDVSNDKVLQFSLFNRNNNTRLSIRSKKTISENTWVHVALTHDGSRKGEGLKLYFNGEWQEDIYLVKDELRGNLRTTLTMYAGAKNPPPIMEPKDPEAEEEDLPRVPKGLQSGQLDELMFFERSLSEAEVNELGKFDPIGTLANSEQLSESDEKRLAYHHLLHEDAEYRRMIHRLREYRIRKGRLEDVVLKPTMIMSDMDTVRATFVLGRGQYDAPQERVESGTPEAVLAFGEEYPANRLGLSQWLFDSQNPLTARVAVNRYWQLIFGKGLVTTPGDFGSQGALPSHPELLDWLALEFQESGWDLKQLIKTMVMSATYRQSVETDPTLQRIDPDNVLLARGPQVRLPAETIRDHALAISGLLSTELGGPSVKPYQPHGLWLEVASGNQSLRKYIQDHERDLYRRSLYTFWKRTIPPPSMTVFDAPSREQCIIERRATSTPMQALTLLNDPQFTEASRLIATRMLAEGGETVADRIQFAFRLATSRAPTAKEIRLLEKLLTAEQADFEANPDAARKLIAVGEYPLPEDISPTELAAYTVLANAILNLTESILKS